MVEHRSPKPRVAGSSPVGPASCNYDMEGECIMSREELFLQLIEKDFPDLGPITENFQGNNRLLNRGSVRISMGRVWTTKGYEKNRKRVYSTKLP